MPDMVGPSGRINVEESKVEEYRAKGYRLASEPEVQDAPAEGQDIADPEVGDDSSEVG